MSILQTEINSPSTFTALLDPIPYGGMHDEFPGSDSRTKKWNSFVRDFSALSTRRSAGCLEALLRP